MFPNRTRIDQNSIMGNGNGFYWVRGYRVISLYRQGNIQTPLGSYCCKIPDRYGASRTFCANLVGRLYCAKFLLCTLENIYIQLAIQCPPVEAPDSGIVSYSNTATNELYIFGTVATYSCSHGFGLSSTQSRVCVGNGTSGTVGMFNGSKPTCEGKQQSLICFMENKTLGLTITIKENL